MPLEPMGVPAPHTYFPFPTIRPPQQLALDGWVKIVERQKRFGVFELPTGAGKSPLAWAIASWAAALPDDGDGFWPGAYILTTQKTLQAQYMRDFRSLGMVELRGAANYRCDPHGSDCAAGGLLDRANAAQLAALKSTDATVEQIIEFERQHPSTCGSCPYRQAKAAFAVNPIGVTNFSYMLSEAKHVRRLKPRELLIIDEAHNTETALLSFVEIEVNTSRAEFVGAPHPPRIEPGDVVTAREWVLSVLLPKCVERLNSLELELDNLVGEPKLREGLLKKANGISQFISRLRFLEDSESLGEWFAHTDTKTGALKLRPLTARSIAEDYLFRMGRRLLFMSATILDGQAFIRGLGLPGSMGGFKRVDSDFPVENRVIHAYPIGSMSFKNIDKSIPRVCSFVDKILTRHQEDKGILHMNSYKLQQALVDYLHKTPHAARIVTHDNQPGSRERAIVHHTTSPHPTVLISPSMTEGLDLADDLSRFQVICKVPYPYLGDPFVKARMAHDPDWYQWQAALTLIQATGRSIRSKEDKAVTYITDSDFQNFMARSGSIIPQWWKDALVWH